MNITKVLRWAVGAGIFLTLLVPLVVSDSLFFPFITGKNFTFRILVELTTGLFAILAIISAAYRPKFSWIAAGVASLAVLIVSDAMGPNPMKSFFSNFERMEGFVTLVHLFAYLIVLGTFLSVERLWEWFWRSSVGVSVIICGYSLMQLAGAITINQGGVRVDATLGNATYLAAYLLFHIFITAFLMVRNRTQMWLNAVYGVVILLQLYVLYHTATRGAILGLLAGGALAAALVALRERERPMIRKAAIGGIVAIVLIVGGFFAIRNTDFAKHSPVLSRFVSISLSESTTKSRFMIWDMAFQGFKEKPIFGWGQENFNYVFNKYYNPGMYAQEQWFDRTHNVVLDWLIAGGILGLLAYLSMFAAALYVLWGRKTNDLRFSERAIFTGLLAGYFIHNLFVFDNITSYLMFFAFLAYLHSESVRPSPWWSTWYGAFAAKRGDSPVARQIGISVAIIATLAVLYMVNFKPVMAASELIDALKPQKAGLSQNIQTFKQIISYGTFGTAETREQLAQLAVKVQTLDANTATPAIKQEFYDFATEELKKQIATIPEDARYEVFFGSFISSSGQYDVAIEHLKRALELSPNKQTILFELGGNYLNTKRYPEAEEAMKKAYDLEPSFEMARILYAVAAIYNGHAADAEKVLVEHFGTVAVADDRLARAYYDTKHYDIVAKIWEAKVAAAPADPQLRISYAAILLQIGDRTGAVREIKKAIELNPTIRDQGEYYIKEIQAGRNP